MAKLIKADGTEVELKGKGKNGELTLEQMQEAVGGYVQHFKNMLMNEDAKQVRLPINLKATDIMRDAIPGFSDCIRGDIIMLKGRSLK